LAETYDQQQEREWHQAASRITEKQLQTAVEMKVRVLGGEASQGDGALLAGLVQAMAINLSTLRRKK
jgi:hypothetical protein